MTILDLQTVLAVVGPLNLIPELPQIPWKPFHAILEPLYLVSFPGPRLDVLAPYLDLYLKIYYYHLIHGGAAAAMGNAH